MQFFFRKQNFYNSATPIVYALLLSALLLTGCMVGPDYQPPEEGIEPQLTPLEYSDIRYDQADLSHWWEVFNDPVLSSLVSRAEKNNFNLMMAMARVKEARAAAGVVSAGLYPSVDGAGGIERSRQSENVNPLAAGEQTRYTLAVDAGWEIDLFGRVRRSLEAAEADYQASWEDRNDVLISVLAETAYQYLQARTLQAQLGTALSNIKSQKAMLRLTEVRYKNGLATYLDVAQATQVLADTEADLPLLRARLAASITSLSVLLGEPSASIGSELQPVHPAPLPPVEVAVGIPAERIRQRPDVRSAERRLAAQTARVGVATADLYPSFSLTGTFGFASLETGNFLASGSQAYGIGPSFRWNLFDMGRIRQLIAVQDARTEQALFAYEISVLRAVKEVEDGLTGYHEQRIRLTALRHSVEASRQTLDMSTKLYKDGLTGFQDVLDAQRSLLAAEGKLDIARGNTGMELVGLYKALAGGWNIQNPQDLPEIKK